MVNNGFKLRPLHTPIDRVTLRQLTTGKEYMIMQEDENPDYGLVPTVEYVGFYHIYPNGAVYTGAAPTPTAQPLVKYFRSDLDVNQQTVNSIPENNLIYAKMTNARFYNYVTPTTYYPVISTKDRQAGTIQRFFMKKINETEIIEVSGETYARRNDSNRVGVDLDLYDYVDIQWSIKGPIEDVRTANRRIILQAETTLPGLRNFLTNLTEFHE